MSMGEALTNVTRTANDMAREIEALRKKLGDQRAYEVRLREQHDLDVAEINRLQIRVFELERPAVEAKRNEIRQSFMELAAAAREARDFEGAFDVDVRLREREEQWATEDAAATPASTPVESAGDETGEAPHRFVKEYQGESDAKRRLARCKHCHGSRDADVHTTGEEYPGELAHLRDLLRGVGRLADKQPEGNPLTELLIDHYSDSRMVDAQLAKGGDR